jgi:hypothetical protein
MHTLMVFAEAVRDGLSDPCIHRRHLQRASGDFQRDRNVTSTRRITGTAHRRVLGASVGAVWSADAYSAPVSLGQPCSPDERRATTGEARCSEPLNTTKSPTRLSSYSRAYQDERGHAVTCRGSLISPRANDGKMRPWKPLDQILPTSA